MNKKAKIFLTIGMATLLLGSGTAMAATATTKDTAKTAVVKSDYMARGNAMHGPVGFSVTARNQELLDLLKVTADELKQSMQDGKSLADLAAAKGVSEQQVIDLIVKQEQADQRSAGLADRVKKMVEAKPGDKGGKSFFPFNDDELAAFLKLDAAALKEKMSSGTQTLAEIAAAQGITKEQLTSFLVEQNTKQLDEAVKSGKMDQTRADQMKKDFPNMVQKMIDSKGKGFVKIEGPFNNEELAAFLKLDAAALKQKMTSGTQTLAEIAAAQGITKEQLTTFLVEQNTKQLDEAVKSGKIDQDHADQMKKDFPNMVQKMIDSKGMMKVKRDFHRGAPQDAKDKTTTTTMN